MGGARAPSDHRREQWKEEKKYTWRGRGHSSVASISEIVFRDDGVMRSREEGEEGE
jgi:hypothetical protein